MRRMMGGRDDPRNPDGVDAPMDRMELVLIFLAIGVLPTGFDDSWKDQLGGHKEESCDVWMCPRCEEWANGSY